MRHHSPYQPPPPTRTGLSRRTLYMVPASVAGVAVVGVLLCLPCVHHHQASLFLSPLPFLVLPFGKPGAPAPPPTCGLACGGRGFDADGVASLVLNSLLLYFGLETDLKHCPHSPSLPPTTTPQQHALLACLPCCLLPSSTTTTRGTACFGASRRRLGPWHGEGARFRAQVRWRV